MPEFLISEAGRRCGLTARAIRIYEERGFISPRRSGKGVRHYCNDDLATLQQISRARAAGLSLAEIGELLDLARRRGPGAYAMRLSEVCGARIRTLRAQAEKLAILAQETTSVAQGSVLAEITSGWDSRWGG